MECSSSNANVNSAKPYLFLPDSESPPVHSAGLTLPIEIWQMILSSLCATSSVRGISSYMLVNREFYHLCIKYCIHFKNRYLVENFNDYAVTDYRCDSHKVTMPWNRKRRLNLLAVGDDGKQYYKKCFESPFSLIIFDPVQMKSHKVKVTKPLEEAKEREKFTAQFIFQQQYSLKIIHCLSLGNQFFVVTTNVISIWQHTSAEPEFVKMLYPIKKPFGWKISSAALFEGKIMLMVTIDKFKKEGIKRIPFIISLDINDGSVVENSISGPLKGQLFHLFQRGDKIGSYTRIYKKNKNFFQGIKDSFKSSSEQRSWKNISSYRFCNLNIAKKTSKKNKNCQLESKFITQSHKIDERDFCATSRSIVFWKGAKELTVIDSKNESQDIDVPFTHTTGPLYIENEFLFVPNAPQSTKCIYLPLKIDLSSKIAEIFKERLDKKLSLFYIGINYPKPNSFKKVEIYCFTYDSTSGGGLKTLFDLHVFTLCNQIKTQDKAVA